MVPGFYRNHDVEVLTLTTLELPHMRHQNASVECISDKFKVTNKEIKDFLWSSLIKSQPDLDCLILFLCPPLFWTLWVLSICNVCCMSLDLCLHKFCFVLCASVSVCLTKGFDSVLLSSTEEATYGKGMGDTLQKPLTEFYKKLSN